MLNASITNPVQSSIGGLNRYGGNSLPNKEDILMLIKNVNDEMVDIIGISTKRYSVAAIQLGAVYVDGTLSVAITNGTYSIANRNNTGTDGNAYPTFNAARIATADGAVIIIRGDAVDGSQLTYAAMTNQNLKAYTIRKYPGDTHKPVMSFASTESGFTFSASKNVVMESIKITGGGAATYGLIFAGAATNQLDDIEVTGWVGVPLRYQLATTTFNHCNIHDNAKRVSWESGTAVANFSIFLRNGDTGESSAFRLQGTSLTTNKCLIWGADVDAVGDSIAKISSGAWTDYNSIIGGIYKTASAYAIERIGGDCTLNNSMVAGNPWNQYTYPAISGTVTQNNCKIGYAPRWVNPGFPAIFTFYLQDSNQADDHTGYGIDLYLTEFPKYNVHFTWFPDDTADFNESGATFDVRREKAADVIASGSELGVQGRSSSRIDVNDPIYIRYTGAGANPQAVIAVTDATTATLDLRIDGASVAGFPIDISREGAYHYIGANTSYLIKKINDLADWECAANYAGNYDDSYAYCLDSGTYNISAEVGGTDILWNMARYLNEEINLSVADMQTAFPAVNFRSYYFPRQMPYPTANANLIAAGIDIALSQSATTGSYLTSITDILDIRNGYLTPAIVKGTGYDVLNAAQKEARIRTFARTWAAVAVSFGLWNSMELPNITLGLTVGFDATELGWFIGQLQDDGVLILNFAEAFDYIAANWTLSGGTYSLSRATEDFRLQATSPCIAAGVDGFVGGSVDQYDADWNMIWHAGLNAPVYHELNGVDIGPYTYGGSSKVYHSLTVSNAWPAFPDLYDVIGKTNAVYNADGTSVVFDTTVLALAGLASLADDRYLWGGTKAAVLYHENMSDQAARIRRYVGDTD